MAEFLNLEYETRSINQFDGIVLSPAYQGKTIGFRPEDAALAKQGQGVLRGRIEAVTPLPLKQKTVLTIRGRHTSFQLYTNQPCQVGDEAEFAIRRFHVFDGKTGKRVATSEAG